MRVAFGEENVKVCLSVVTDVGAVTLGTGTVTVPIMMILDALDTIVSPLSLAHMAAGADVILPFPVGEVSNVV